MHLFLIRHGESYVNLPDFNGANWDEGLTPLGQQQAESLAAWVRDYLRPVALYTSTMRRATETAERIAGATGLPAVGNDRLREIGTCWADSSPAPVGEDPPAYADFWASQRPFDAIFEGGESWTDFFGRVGRFLGEVLARYGETDRHILAVCHGGVINAAVDVVFGVGPWRRVDLWAHNTGITHLEYWPDSVRQEQWRLHGFNIAYHLQGENGSFPGYRK